MDYHFVFAENGTIPPGAQPNGNEANGDPLWVARSPGRTDPFFFHGGIYPGKVRPGFGTAFIPFGGNEESVPHYEVLMEAGIWIAGSGGQIPDGAIVCTRLVNRSSTVAQLTAYSKHAGSEAGVLEQADS